MSAIVSQVLKNSIAEELDILAGDEILAIDDVKIRDLIDYNFYCKSEFLTLCIKKNDGEIEEIEIEKDFDEDLGIIFESAVFDKIKPCCNKCIFCFVDQQPKGLRDTLYIKDDDYRLSYLQGTYITLTNLKNEDRKRIEALRLGPLYVSVHTTNPELRAKMLRNPKASQILEQLKWLESIDIPIHCQIVLCPTFNDNDELERTLKDLKSLKNVLSVAIVPIGLTKFRDEKLPSVDKKNALKTIKIASKFKKVCCADEIFLLAEKEIPPSEYYGNFSQLADGVGSIRFLLDDFLAQKLPKKIATKNKITLATSVAATSAFNIICEKLNNIENLITNVVTVNSTYWGDNITVAGLITSNDLINALKNDSSDYIILPSVMLKPFSENFLDGVSLSTVKNVLNKEITVIQDYNSTKEIVDFINTLV